MSKVICTFIDHWNLTLCSTFPLHIWKLHRIATLSLDFECIGAGDLREFHACMKSIMSAIIIDRLYQQSLPRNVVKKFAKWKRWQQRIEITSFSSFFSTFVGEYYHQGYQYRFLRGCASLFRGESTLPAIFALHTSW